MGILKRPREKMIVFEIEIISSYGIEHQEEDSSVL
jgi:hypothetical protein